MNAGFQRRWILVAAAALAVLLLVPWPWDGPRYRGRPLRYWFPRWEPLGHDWLDERLMPLKQAGPEALPVVLAGLEATDNPFDAGYDDWLGRLPVMLRAWLPSRIPASMTRRHAGEVLPVWLRRGAEHQRAFTNAFDRLPVEVRVQSCRWWDPGVHDWTVISPHLRRIAASDPEAAVALGAGVALLETGAGGGEPDLAATVARLSTMPSGVWFDGIWPDHGDVAQRLALHGTRARAAEPWFRGWLGTGSPPARASAALALPFIAPERHPVGPTLAAVLPEIGPEGVRQFWALRRMEAPEFRETRMAFATELGRVFLTADAGGWRTVWTQAVPGRGRTWIRPSSFSDLQLTGLSLYRSLGREARPVAEMLPPLLSSVDPRVAFEAARCLAQVGPVIPATIPMMIRGLTNEATAPQLVLLMAAYGPAARPAVPVLESLAGGDALLIGRRDLGPPGRDLVTLRGLPTNRRGVVRPGGFLRSSNVVVGHRLASSLGMADVWPAGPGLEGSSGTNARLSLADLAAEALRRIGAGAEAGP